MSHESEKNIYAYKIITSSEKNIMAIKIKGKNIYGLQFHPESIATSYGKVFFKNFIKICYG